MTQTIRVESAPGLPDDRPPRIDIPSLAEISLERHEELEQEADALAGLPVKVKIGALEFDLPPPTEGKIRLIIRMVKEFVVTNEDFWTQVRSKEVNVSTFLEQGISYSDKALDALRDVIRVLLEPNPTTGPITVGNLSTPADLLEFNLDSASFQRVIREAIALIDFPGLKKTLQRVK